MILDLLNVGREPARTAYFNTGAKELLALVDGRGIGSSLACLNRTCQKNKMAGGLFTASVDGVVAKGDDHDPIPMNKPLASRTLRRRLRFIHSSQKVQRETESLATT